MIKRIERYIGLKRKEKSRARERTSSSEIFDPHLTYDYNSSEHWSYKKGRIQINDQDVDDLVNSYPRDISLLSNIFLALQDYRNFVWSKGVKDHEKFNNTIFGLQEKVGIRLANIYGEITGGIRVECNSDGSFWLNDIEMRKLLALYSSRPTEKARLYLEGLKNKLCWIIQSKNVTNKNDGIRAVAQSMVAQIEDTLERISTRKLLPSAHSSTG